MRLPELPELPVRAALPDITATLRAAGSAVLVAPAGTGKTTLVPLALAAACHGRVVVAEPRRLAARAAAARMASLLGEQVGATVGYAIRGERRSCAATRIEVVTSGLLVRRLQSDPELAGVDVVVLDECHERHLDADLLLALLADARAGLRPDLRLLATSATVAAERLATLLGDAPVLRVAGRTYPLDICYLPPARTEHLAGTVARAIRRALADGEGDVLAFLPGAAEIERTAALLRSLPDVDIRRLHGRLPAAEQSAALRQGERRRVVLSTAVAESSLTVPGVRAVVDSGMARVPRTDHRRGLPGLATVRVSAAVAEQRAGRAGREDHGRVYRCWPEHEHSTLPRYPEPEIRTAELTGLALELACWGTPDGTALRWWDPPPPGALAVADGTLRTLGALDSDGHVTTRGKRMAALGLHPRLARALLDGADQVGADAAARVVALLDADSTPGPDIADALRGGGPWQASAKRLAARVSGTQRRPETEAAALVVALAFPERLARRREPGSRTYLMAGGTAADVRGTLAHAEWLAIAIADRALGKASATVRLAAVADEELALRAAPSLLSEVDDIRWHEGDVVARRVRSLGAITLSARPLRMPDPAPVRTAVLTGLRADGLALLNWTAAATKFRDRLAFLHREIGSPWPPVDDTALLSDADSWLEPDLSRARRRADLARIPVSQSLRRLLPWPAAARLDELAPERLAVPSGARPRIDYSHEQPVVALKVQDAFGWRATPLIAEGTVPVVLHLLSPSGHTAAVTSDLDSFWRNGYQQVRAELRGRYPKHRWPEHP